MRERCPALVVAASVIQEQHGLLWVMMITSSENRCWPGDIAISDLGAAGLSAASVVRTAKMATIEAREVERIGVLPAGDRAAVRGDILAVLSEAVKAPRHSRAPRGRVVPPVGRE